MQVDFFHDASSSSPVLTVTAGLESVPLQEGVFQLKLTLSAGDYHAVFSGVSQPVYVQITDLTHAKNVSVLNSRGTLITIPHDLIDGGAAVHLSWRAVWY
jgi:hypothetical protein